MVLMFNPVKFIEEVKLRPALFNSELAADRAEKVRLWKEVGAAMFPDWETCSKAVAYDRVLQLQKKWRSLRDAYSRELRHRRSPNSAGPRKIYRYFKRMSFLGGHDGDISPPGESDADDDAQKLLYPMGDMQYAENSILPDEDSDCPPVKKAKKKKRKRASSGSIHAEEEYEIPMPMFSSDVQDDSDSDKLFLMSFVPEMRQLPSNIKMWARAQIANIMQEAVNSHYNNTMPRTAAENSSCVQKHNILENTD